MTLSYTPTAQMWETFRGGADLIREAVELVLDRERSVVTAEVYHTP